MRCIGLLINPIAGMGGPVGLKGTDGNVGEARSRGAVPQAQKRVKATLEKVAGNKELFFLTCSGEMGEVALKEIGMRNYRVLYTYSGDSTAQDTRSAARMFLEAGVEMILFCGGDGTARDIFDSVGTDIPILGIPAGVKMYSAVFAINPATAADIVTGYEQDVLRDSEVIDVDEGAYRAGELATRLYGIARTPALAGKLQVSKQVFEESGEERAKEEIARFIQEVMLPDTMYIMGAGTTTESIARQAGIRKTLLGVDVIRNGALVAPDADEKTLLALLEGDDQAKIIISPIGAQGFIFGRGNQQISRQVIQKVGLNNIIVVATPQKLAGTPALYVDTGDELLDRQFGDSIQVISGYRMAQRKKIRQPEPGT
jgi:predicted polyphosphate/ATP-dependent NAD kinase